MVPHDQPEASLVSSLMLGKSKAAHPTQKDMFTRWILDEALTLN